MFFVPMMGRTKGRSRVSGWAAMLLLVLPVACQALPARLVLALDGVAYRDLQALQAGVRRTNFWGQTRVLRAFTADEGYFPVSRMVSTFPSASDVAWTDIFGDRPLPGYQRTYYCAGANALVAVNGVTTTMEHERQMDWQLQNGFLRAMGYMFPVHTLRHETHGLITHFWQTTSQERDYYAYFRASDDAQHLDRDILVLLCGLDRELQQLRARYQAREGHDLEIVILSDHGHNHAGRGIRVQDAAFLKQAGYRVAQSITGPKDVVLPIVGVESWVEVHCAPAETEKLARLLCGLPGVDVLAAVIPDQANQFLILNSHGEQAAILWKPEDNTFRYVPVRGDPIQYGPVVATLARKQQLDADGFATADDWMAATIDHRYPLALERIARGLTRGALNPATILISLDNRYVNDSWLVQQGSRLVSCGSTHGGLDDLCSDGILLSNFAPTRDTSTSRVAGQFENFPGVRNYRAEESGGELLTKKEQALTRIPRVPLDREWKRLSDDAIYLRVWSPELAKVDGSTPLVAAIEKVPRYATPPAPRQLRLEHPLMLAGGANERIYVFPADLHLEPQAEYNLSVRLQTKKKATLLLQFSFRTAFDGQPVPF